MTEITSLADIICVHGTAAPIVRALIVGERRVSWGELAARAQQVANAMADAGVGSQDRISLLDKNGIEHFEAFRGAALLNAVCVWRRRPYRALRDEAWGGVTSRSSSTARVAISSVGVRFMRTAPRRLRCRRHRSHAPQTRSTPLGHLTTMPGIHEPETIDLIARAADGRYLLVMIETRPWGSDPGQADQLKAKINTYAQFALDGGLLRHHPEAANQPIAIRLDCPAAPDEATSAIMSRAAEQLARFNIEILININPSL
jgi:hypothetical protein